MLAQGMIWRRQTTLHGCARNSLLARQGAERGSLDTANSSDVCSWEVWKPPGFLLPVIHACGGCEKHFQKAMSSLCSPGFKLNISSSPISLKTSFKPGEGSGVRQSLSTGIGSHPAHHSPGSSSLKSREVFVCGFELGKGQQWQDQVCLGQWWWAGGCGRAGGCQPGWAVPAGSGQQCSHTLSVHSFFMPHFQACLIYEPHSSFPLV